MTDFENNPVTLSGVAMPDPKSVGTCRIEARLSSQGSRLYRAVDLSLGKTVVVKLMQPPHDEDERAVERFLAFGGALVGVASPHVVPVLRTGRDGPTPYIVMDYVDGEDLESVLKREKSLVPQAALRAVLDAASGLDAAMRRGALHGDIRPRHLLRVRGEIKVTSFGLSAPTTTAQGRTIAGHPAYVAPEIVNPSRGPADHRADIYALGCTLFELVVGRPPYGTASADALLACQLHEPFPSLRAQQPRATPELEAFLQRMVAKDVTRRFATYAELLQAGAALLPKLRHLQPQQTVLLVEDGRQQGTRIELPEGEFLLGRIPGEGFALDDARVSRRHALVKRSGDYLEVEDLGSRNGIRVNGVDTRSRQLFPGDRIEIGDTVLRVDGPSTAVAQIPAQGRAVASPLRGAFGDVEVSHPPQRQMPPQALGDPAAPGLPERLAVLARLAPLFAGRSGNPETLRLDAVALVAEVLKADHKIVIKVKDNQPVFEAASAFDAQLLSGTLPAVERALPGQLSLATTVRVNVDDRWSVVLAPIIERGHTRALAVLVKRVGRFDDNALGVLEATCGLLSLRAESAVSL